MTNYSNQCNSMHMDNTVIDLVDRRRDVRILERDESRSDRTPAFDLTLKRLSKGELIPRGKDDKEKNGR